MNSPIKKVICRGEIRGRTSWSTWAEAVNVRADGALVIKGLPVCGGARMGFRAGAWSFRKRAGDYDVYDVDFSKRFAPRRFA